MFVLVYFILFFCEIGEILSCLDIRLYANDVRKPTYTVKLSQQILVKIQNSVESFLSALYPKGKFRSNSAS